MTPSPGGLRFHIEFRPYNAPAASLGAVAGLRPAAGAFEETYRRLVSARARGRLVLLCEVGAGLALVASRLVAAGLID